MVTATRNSPSSKKPNSNKKTYYVVEHPGVSAEVVFGNEELERMLEYTDSEVEVHSYTNVTWATKRCKAILNAIKSAEAAKATEENTTKDRSKLDSTQSTKPHPMPDMIEIKDATTTNTKAKDVSDTSSLNSNVTHAGVVSLQSASNVLPADKTQTNIDSSSNLPIADDPFNIECPVDTASVPNTNHDTDPFLVNVPDDDIPLKSDKASTVTPSASPSINKKRKATDSEEDNKIITPLKLSVLSPANRKQARSDPKLKMEYIVLGRKIKVVVELLDYRGRVNYAYKPHFIYDIITADLSKDWKDKPDLLSSGYVEMLQKRATPHGPDIPVPGYKEDPFTVMVFTLKFNSAFQKAADVVTNLGEKFLACLRHDTFAHVYIGVVDD